MVDRVGQQPDHFPLLRVLEQGAFAKAYQEELQKIPLTDSDEDKSSEAGLPAGRLNRRRFLQTAATAFVTMATLPRRRL